MSRWAQLDVRAAHRNIVAPILAAILVAVVVLNVPGVRTSVILRAADLEPAQDRAIDIWQLHLQADIEHMPALIVADLV